MGKLYANIIVDISPGWIAVFQYGFRRYAGSLEVGMVSSCSAFRMSSRRMKGYVIEITDKAEYPPRRYEGNSEKQLRTPVGRIPV